MEIFETNGLLILERHLSCMGCCHCWVRLHEELACLDPAAIGPRFAGEWILSWMHFSVELLVHQV